MANTNVYDFLGDYSSYFQKASWQAYTDASGSMQYVGKVNAEVTIAPNMEYAEWWDNTSGTQSLFVLTPDKIDPMINFSFMQVLDPNVLAMALNLDLDTSDPNKVRSYIGSGPQDLGEYGWRFVTRSISGLVMTLVVRRGVVVNTGELASGAAGEFTNVPISCRMLQDTDITNTERDMGWFEIDKRSFS